MSDQHIHDQGTGIQVQVTGGKANVAKTIIINEPLPSPSPTGIPSNLPQYLGPTFRGREDDWDKLHDALQQTERVAITALHGMGGVGKTELALQYATAKLREGAYPGGVCWLGAREQDIGTQITQYFQAQLGLQLPEGLDDLAAQVGYCWRHWREGEVLVVVDDVAYQRVAEYEKTIKPYLPTDPRFRVVVTTRQDLGASFHRVLLGVLAEGAALDVLRDLAGASRIDGQLAEAQRLCEWLGYLPLGLELVGRYLANKPDLSLAETLRRLESQKLAARALNKPEEVMTATHESVAAAFELSWNDLTEAQRQLGERLSLFALVPIPWALVAAVQPEADVEALEDDRDALVNRNLLNRVGEGSYQLHSLIREFFAAKREQENNTKTLKQAHCAALVQIAKAIPWTAPQATYLALAPVVPHLVEVVNHHMQAVSDEAVLSPANGLAMFYYGQGLYAEGVRWAERCKEQVEARLGADHPATAASLNNLAQLYYSMGRYSEAEPLYGRSLAIREAQLGADHPDTATSLNNLAGLYESMGRYREAEPLYGRSLAIREAQLGADHPNTAASLNNLAQLYYSMGRYSEAEPLYGRSLAITEAQLGADHPDTATSLNNLAGLYRAMGRYSEAEPLYRRSLAIREAQLGADHPNTAASLNNLAQLYYSMGRYSEAEPLYGRSLAIREAQLGADHPDTATSLNNLAGLYESMGRYREAEPLYGRSLAIKEAQLGADHPDTAASLNNLAGLYESMGRYREAEPLYGRSLAIREAQLGADHPDTATSLNNLAGLYESMGRYSEAEPLYGRSLAIREAQLGADHPDTATSLNNLAQLYYSMGRYSEAEPLYLKALPILFSRLGQDHPTSQTVWQNFLGLLIEAVQAGRAGELSDHPLTQALLAQLQAERNPS